MRYHDAQHVFEVETHREWYVLGGRSQHSQCVRFRMAPAAFTSDSLIEGYKRYASIRADCGPAAAALVHTQIVSGC